MTAKVHKLSNQKTKREKRELSQAALATQEINNFYWRNSCASRDQMVWKALYSLTGGGKRLFAGSNMSLARHVIGAKNIDSQTERQVGESISRLVSRGQAERLLMGGGQHAGRGRKRLLACRLPGQEAYFTPKRCKGIKILGWDETLRCLIEHRGALRGKFLDDGAARLAAQAEFEAEVAADYAEHKAKQARRQAPNKQTTNPRKSGVEKTGNSENFSPKARHNSEKHQNPETSDQPPEVGGRKRPPTREYKEPCVSSIELISPNQGLRPGSDLTGKRLTAHVQEDPTPTLPDQPDPEQSSNADLERLERVAFERYTGSAWSDNPTERAKAVRSAFDASLAGSGLTLSPERQAAMLAGQLKHYGLAANA